MKLKYIIADSGGTKTDFYAVTVNGDGLQLTRNSYHPSAINEAFVLEERKFWSDFDLSDATLDFYGAGCLKEEKQEIVKYHLRNMGFLQTKVESDIYLASKSLRIEDGFVAITGTGSVVVKLEAGKITELRGGLGWELGDEGGGFYFGKLLLQEMKEYPKKNPEIEQKIENFKPLTELFELENDAASRSIYAKLPVLLSEYKSHELLKNIHEKNIQLFFDLYLKGVSKVGIVGSYAFHQQEIFQKIANQQSIEIVKFIERPLEELVKTFLFVEK